MELGAADKECVAAMELAAAEPMKINLKLINPRTDLEEELTDDNVKKLMTRELSTLSRDRDAKLVATLIASPRFKAQKPITRLNVSVMAFCVMRNGWLSFAHTHFGSQRCGTHAASSGYASLSHRTSHSIIYVIYIP